MIVVIVIRSGWLYIEKVLSIVTKIQFDEGRKQFARTSLKEKYQMQKEQME
jgi:hypothetical protein